MPGHPLHVENIALVVASGLGGSGLPASAAHVGALADAGGPGIVTMDTTAMCRPLNEWRSVPGFVSIFFGAVCAFPLPQLPRFPIIIIIVSSDERDMPRLPAALEPAPILALPWCPEPTQVVSASAGVITDVPVVAVPPVCAPAQRRRGRPPGASVARALAPQRASPRLAAVDSGAFINMTTKAIARKALRECLAPCSEELKKQVAQRCVLEKKNPLKALDLSHLAKAAELDLPARRAVAVAAATGHYP